MISLLGFDAYGRLGALLSIKNRDLLKPVRGMRPQRWDVVFFPEPDGAVSRTKTQDDTVLIGETHADRQWLNQLLPPLVRRSHRS